VREQELGRDATAVGARSAERAFLHYGGAKARGVGRTIDIRGIPGSENDQVEVTHASSDALTAECYRAPEGDDGPLPSRGQEVSAPNGARRQNSLVSDCVAAGRDESLRFSS
jgi:hypothetical protein